MYSGRDGYKKTRGSATKGGRGGSGDRTRKVDLSKNRWIQGSVFGPWVPVEERRYSGGTAGVQRERASGRFNGEGSRMPWGKASLDGPCSEADPGVVRGRGRIKE